MDENINDIWASVLENIKDNVNTPTFKTWFENVVPISLKTL